MYKIGIDPGHGGKDPGAIGPSGLQEKEVVLSVSLLLRDLLKANDLEVICTRSTDKYLSLSERSNMLNAAKVDLVLSLHVNSIETPEANYVANFIIGRGGQAEKAAKVIQEELRVATGWPGPAEPDGVKVKNLHMVRETEAPAVITEMGFISNPVQEMQLKDQAFHKTLAIAIARGVCRHFGIKFQEQQFTPIAEVDIVKVVSEEKDYSGILINGKTHVHVRVIEEYGIPVYWDQDSKTVYIGKVPSKTQQNLPRYEHYQTHDVITARPEQLKVAMIRGHLNMDGINGGYLDGKLNPLGVVIIDGKIIADRATHRPPRTVFIIDGNKADITTNVENAGSIMAKYALGAGPSLLPTVATDEGFRDDIMKSIRERSAVGITAEGLVKLVATKPMTLDQLSSLMKSIGCIKAMNLDGGKSSHMRWQGKTIKGGGRAISTAIILAENVKPSQ